MSSSLWCWASSSASSVLLELSLSFSVSLSLSLSFHLRLFLLQLLSFHIHLFFVAGLLLSLATCLSISTLSHDVCWSANAARRMCGDGCRGLGCARSTIVNAAVAYGPCRTSGTSGTSNTYHI